MESRREACWVFGTPTRGDEGNGEGREWAAPAAARQTIESLKSRSRRTVVGMSFPQAFELGRNGDATAANDRTQCDKSIEPHRIQTQTAPVSVTTVVSRDRHNCRQNDARIEFVGEIVLAKRVRVRGLAMSHREAIGKGSDEGRRVATGHRINVTEFQSHVRSGKTGHR